MSLALEEMSLQMLRQLAKAHGITVRPCKRAELIDILVSNQISDWPLRIHEEPLQEAHRAPVTEAEYPKLAIHVSARTLVQGVGIFEPGYHILDRAVAESLIGKTKRIRLASPGEVAEYYGVR